MTELPRGWQRAVWLEWTGAGSAGPNHRCVGWSWGWGAAEAHDAPAPCGQPRGHLLPEPIATTNPVLLCFQRYSLYVVPQALCWKRRWIWTNVHWEWPTTMEWSPNPSAAAHQSPKSLPWTAPPSLTRYGSRRLSCFCLHQEVILFELCP